MIVIAGNGPTAWMMELLPLIKRDSSLQFVPIILFHPAPDKQMIIEAYKLGVDEVVTNFWDFELVQAKVEMLIARSRRDLGVNPTTKLPGPAAIEHEINMRLKEGKEFAVCYADLDNFKAYNDYHGYFFGDKIILMTSHIIRNTVQDLVEGGFVGHIGGDDYVFVIPLEKVHIVCKNVISTFDKMIPFRYSEADREKGFIEVANRRGVLEEYPIMSISIAVVPNQERTFTHVGEMSHMMADLKKYTKSLPGSNYMIERRKKY
jgi:diguanylate cyclase (GGDEF)-like protein